MTTQQRVATDAAIRELAQAIEAQAQAIADGRTTADPHAVAKLLEGNVATLIAWTAPRPTEGPCPRCGGINGAHGLVHRQTATGGRANIPCPDR